MIEECFGEQVDGIWQTSGCSCPECRQFEDDEIEHAVEYGEISESAALALHAANDLLRGDTGDDESGAAL